MFTRLRKIRPAGFIAGFLAAAVISGTGVAYAANGGGFLLGSNNYESRGAGLSNSAGTPLYLSSKAGTPPLVVYSTTKVPRLNADSLDGLDQSAFLRSSAAGGFALTAGQTGIIVGSITDDDGYDNTAHCPAGTISTGGGGYADTYGDHLIYSGPDVDANTGAIIPNSWFVESDTHAIAYVTCYNPRGAVPGAAGNINSVSGLAASGKITPGAQKVVPGRKQ